MRSFTFRDLRQKCGDISPTVLNSHLRELKESGIVALEKGEGYGLTERGRDLTQAIAPLSKWAEDWTQKNPGKG